MSNMSSSKVRKFKRTLDFTATWAINTLTVTTTGNHYLVTGDVVDIFAGHGAFTIINAAVTVVDADTFTVATSDAFSFMDGKVQIDLFRTGQTGRFVITSPRSVGNSAVIQSFVTGTGGATYNIDASLDGVHWTNIATVTHAGTTGDTQFAQIAPMWAYVSIDITAIGADTSLVAMYSA